jgi:uncharacterized protein (TIGR02145 family)
VKFSRLFFLQCEPGGLPGLISTGFEINNLIQIPISPSVRQLPILDPDNLIVCDLHTLFPYLDLVLMKKINLILLICLCISTATDRLIAQPTKTKPKAAVIKNVPKEIPKPIAKEIPKENALDYGYGVKDAPVIVLGPQQWLGKNLAVTAFANGDQITQAQSEEDWIKAGKEQRPAWCYYNNDPLNGQTYGVLYNWYAVADPRGLAPKGWHVPTKYEWIPLFDFLGDKGEIGHKMKSTTLWQPIGGPDRNGTNETGFGAMPGGLRFAEDGTFSALGERGQFWSATENESERSAMVAFGISHTVTLGIAGKGFGYSVRCVKD